MAKNHLGLDGLEFIEFSGPDVSMLDSLCLRLGLVPVARNQSCDLRLFRYNDIQFIINNDLSSFAADFSKRHGPSASATGFRVKDAQFAFDEAVRRGAKPFTEEGKKSGWNLPAIYGIGDSLIYFVDQYGDRGDTYSDSWSWQGTSRRPGGSGLQVIDHMTNNVPKGEMQKWCDFYTDIFGFEEKRYFDIRGKQTGLLSKVMRSPCGKFSIPINEPSDPKSQIQEYLDEYKGSGIQHIAFLTDDIVTSVKKLMSSKIEFLKAPPATYYRALPTRLPGIKEDISVLQDLAILADGDDDGYLLQIFTKNQVGPIFIEIIQRALHEGFGEGNFQALFDSMEEDQRERGVL